MSKLGMILALLCLAVVIQADTRKQPQGKNVLDVITPTTRNHPYLFLTVPRGRAGTILQGFEVRHNDDIQDESENDANDEEEEDNIEAHNDDIIDYDISDDDASQSKYDFLSKQQPISLRLVGTTIPSESDNNNNDYSNEEDDAEEMDIGVASIVDASRRQVKNAKPTQMLVSREHAGAIMVPDGIIEIDGQTIVDEKTGNAALLVPRSAIGTIPNGSIVAVMERSIDVDENGEERANRVVVRRRRKGSRRNVRRRKNKNNRRRRRGGNNRRRGNKRKNVNTVRYGGGNRRRRGGNRRNRRPVALQG